MKKINQAFTNPDFWLLYEHLHFQQTKSKDAMSWMLALSKDFEVKTEHKQYVQTAKEQQEMHLNSIVINVLEKEIDPCDENYKEIYNQRFQNLKKSLAQREENYVERFKEIAHHYEYTTLTFRFPLPHPYGLKLVVEVDIEAYAMPDQSLYFTTDEQNFQIGYWDRSHDLPYCIRLEELDHFERYWKSQGGYWKACSEIAWALLAKFVGVDSSEDYKSINHTYNAILSSLGVKSQQKFHLQKNCQWMQTKKGFEFVGVSLPAHLQHLQNSNTFQEMNVRALSHSLRKQREDLEEGEVAFPFLAWDKMINSLS